MSIKKIVIISFEEINVRPKIFLILYPH
jgi:hypothetical protein